jgi:2-C-methyl-D-erythritol 4-phosphate cytidylyltransferase
MVDGHADAVRFTLPADAELLDAIITSRRSN